MGSPYTIFGLKIVHIIIWVVKHRIEGFRKKKKKKRCKKRPYSRHFQYPKHTLNRSSGISLFFVLFFFGAGLFRGISPGCDHPGGVIPFFIFVEKILVSKNSYFSI